MDIMSRGAKVIVCSAGILGAIAASAGKIASAVGISAGTILIGVAVCEVILLFILLRLKRREHASIHPSTGVD